MLVGSLCGSSDKQEGSIFSKQLLTDYYHSRDTRTVLQTRYPLQNEIYFSDFEVELLRPGSYPVDNMEFAQVDSIASRPVHVRCMTTHYDHSQVLPDGNLRVFGRSMDFVMASEVPPAPGKIRSSIWKGSPNATGDGTPRLEELSSDVDVMVAPFSASGPMPRAHFFFNTGYSVPGSAPPHVLDETFRQTVHSPVLFPRNCELRMESRPVVGRKMRFVLFFANLHRRGVRIDLPPNDLPGASFLEFELSEWRADGLITANRFPLAGGVLVPGRDAEYEYVVPSVPHVG